jgi:multiple sugar transport system permease protein
MMQGLRPSQALIFVLLAVWSLVSIFPLYWMFVASLMPPEAVESGPHFLPFVDFQPSLDAWRFILFDRHENFWASYVNSVIVAVCSTGLTLCAAIPSVYAITRQTQTVSRSSGWLLGAAIATRALPPFIVALPIYVMAQHSGLLDSQLLLILVHAAINLPVAMWLLLPVLGRTATAQEEAAKIEGAGSVEILVGILLPMVAGGLAAVALIVFLQSWNEYVLAVTLTTNKAMTMPPFLVGQLSIKEAQVGGDAEEWPRFSAVAMLMALPVLTSTVFVQKYLGRLVATR